VKKRCGWSDRRRLVGFGRVLEFLQFYPDLVGVEVVELVEDVQGVLPGGAGRVGAAGGVVGVAEGGEDDGFL
jgi:hypothetical protein